ncbi:methyltransferase domain-containing protein [Actinomadura sp. 7K507]|uniref:methyltransferase domain-containing protein n=1 Tax=Actinomadura sp. 7K507 TaxID=2530365 RepID=UPI00104AEE4A|nr:methyltransferase domain-containing protein [Actinomadura sp. 7K507]TDC80144.1 methyltransferase domain-containing protein [Actinomadura sp. 7K507]
MSNTVVADDAVAKAAAAVSRDHYVDHPRLGRVPQVTAQVAIERDLRRLDIQPGQRVLELGTGTGLTGGLLAELVGAEGHVVSIDIAPDLTQRAATLHDERGVSNLTLLCRDGHRGAPEHGPYDVIVAWCTPTHIPQAWIDQAAPGGLVSTPIYLAEVARAVGHVRATVNTAGDLVDPRLGQAVYVDMGEEINTTLGVPLFYIDAEDRADNGDRAWVSVAWRGRYEGHDPAATLAMLRRPDHHTEPVPLGDTEEQRALAWRDFRSYSAARDAAHPVSSLTYFGTSGTTWESGIGFSSGNNAALLMADGHLRANKPDSPALTKLRDYYESWQDAGRPGLDDLTATLHQTATGWQVRTALQD